MKTKHLFFAAALMTSFAACTSEDFMMDDMQNAAGTRPVVDNVKLHFGANDALTRVVYENKSYAWQSTDTIGALLMDNVNTPYNPSAPWGAKYTLTPYIHTSFPFTYNSEDESWGCDTKMLEGNYFFAWPWEDYDGNRQVSHSLLNQQQNGVGIDVRAKSYADNQFFVGYSQIKAGTKDGDVLNNVKMTPVLGAIQFQIKNNGTQTYHINKIVLSGNSKIASAVTIDPSAVNGTYYYDNDWHFNYAKYLGLEDPANDDYKSIEALRKTVVPVAGIVDKSAQLVINGTEEERALNSDGTTAYALIMCNPLTADDIAAYGGLKLSIYTDEGMVSDIDLTKVYAEKEDYKVVTTSKVTEISLDQPNTIGIYLDDNSFIVPEVLSIYNSNDLEQYIKWNNNMAGTRTVTANLKQDVVLADSVAALLTESKNTTLTINGAEGDLILDADVPADFFDSKRVKVADLDIEVRGTMALTKDTKGVKSIAVAEGATLQINTGTAKVPANIYNNGNVEMGSAAAVKSSTNIQNNEGGVVTLAEEGDSKAKITNKEGATINNDGFMQNVNNEKGGLLVMGENAQLSSTENNGTIETAAGSKVNVYGTGEVEYKHNAVLEEIGSNTIFAKYAGGTIDENSFNKKNVTELILTEGTTKLGADKTFNQVIVEGTASINTNGKTLTVTTLSIEKGKATVDGTGKIKAGTVYVKEEATLVNNSTINVNDYGTFQNFGTVNNHGYIGGLEVNWKKEDGSVWRYNNEDDKKKGPEPDPTATESLTAAIQAWVNSWTYSTGFVGNPFDEKADVVAFDTYIKGLAADDEIRTDYENYYLKQGDKTYAADTKERLLTTDGTKPNDTFKNAVIAAGSLSTTKVKAAVVKDGVLITKIADLVLNGEESKFPTLYDTQAKAYAETNLRALIANKMSEIWTTVDHDTFFDEETNDDDHQKALFTVGAYLLSDAEIKGLLELHENAKFAFIWRDATTSPLYDVMTRYMKYSPDTWDAAFGGAALDRITSMETLKAFFLRASIEKESSTVLDVAKGIVTSYPELESWKYSNAQFAQFNVLHKDATIAAANFVVAEINRMLVDYNIYDTQDELLSTKAVKDALNAFGGAATLAIAEEAIEIAVVNLSTEAAAAWALTPAITTAADAFIVQLEQCNGTGLDTNENILRTAVNGTFETNAAMDAYWDAVHGTTGGKAKAYTEDDVNEAIAVAEAKANTTVLKNSAWTKK